jgi:replication-associated recombination protein RarA
MIWFFPSATKYGLYDKTGEQHYDIVSAFIKSIRGSDLMVLYIGSTND